MKACRKLKQTYSHHKETILMCLGILLGVVAGSIAGSLRTFTSREIMYIGFLGTIYMRALRMVASPLLVSSLVSATANLEDGMTWKMFLQYVVIILFLDVEGAFLAITFALAIRPGMPEYGAHDVVQLKPIKLQDMFLDLGRNFVPSNPIRMFVHSYETVIRNSTSGEWEFVPGGEVLHCINLVGIVVLSVIFGIVMKKLGDEVTFLKNLVDSIAAVTFLWKKWIMLASPLLLASLIGAQILRVGPHILIATTGRYIITFLSYSLTQILIMYPLAFFVLTRKNAFRYYSGEVILTAFATSSTLATLPMAIVFLEQSCNFNPRMVRLFLSIGANITKVGNLMTLCGMTIFMAQAHNMPMSFTLILKIVLISLPISMAIPGVPYGVIASLLTVLGGCCIPADNVGLVLSVEWLNDRFITLINVLGNVLTVAIMASYYNELFLPQNAEESLESISET